MMKNLNFYLVCVMLSITLSAFAYDFEVDGIYYNINIEERTASIASGNNNYEGDIVIPASVTYANQEIPVTSINSYAFSYCNKLISIEIPHTITSIGSRAFEGCDSLVKVNITDLSSWCNIEFYDYYSNPLSCAHNLYLNNLQIKDLIIPTSINSIHPYNFSGCYLETVEIPNSVTSIGFEAFYRCSDLISVDIPNSMISIGGSAFANCSSITSVEIPNSVISIGGSAFSNCSSLTSVEIPNSVLSIDNDAFENCVNLERVDISDIGSWCEIRFGNQTSNPLYYANHLYLNKEEVLNLLIPNSINSINNYAFQNCFSIINLIIPGSIDKIDKDAFTGCDNLVKLTLESGNNYLTIEGSFGPSLEELFLGRNLTHSSKAFSDTKKLKEISIGPLVSSASNLYLKEYDNLTTINSYNNEPPSIEELNNIQYASVIVNIPLGSLRAYEKAKIWKNFWNITEDPNLISKFEIDKITYFVIGENAVSVYSANLSQSPELSITNQVEYKGKIYNIISISNEAFKNCSNLNKISIPSSITSIGDNAFKGCSSLKEVILDYGSTLTMGCGDLVMSSSVVPHPNPSTVDERRTGYRSGYYEGLFSGLPIERLVINRNIKLPLYYKRELGTKTSNYETVYNDITYLSPFDDLTKLKYLEIGEEVEYICLNTLKAVVNGVESTFSYSNFKGADNLEIVISKNPTAPVGGGFSQTAYENAILNLPNGGKTSYQDDEYWKKFVNIIEGNYIPVESIRIEQESVELPIEETLQLSLIVNPENATYSVLWTSSNEKIVTVTETGILTGIAKGSAVVTAKIGNFTATCEVKVYNPEIKAESIMLNIEKAELFINDTLQLDATVFPEETTNKTIKWKSSNDHIVKIINQGLVMAISEGTAVITAICGEVSASCEITVLNPIIEPQEIVLNIESVELNIGEKVPLYATIFPEDTTDKTIIWNSSNEEIAIVSEKGMVTAISEGNAIITATCGEVWASCTVTVSPILAQSVTLNIETAEIIIGEIVQLDASVHPEDTSDKTLSWNSSDPNIASVSDNGLVTAISIGKAIITATCGNASAECAITVLEDAGIESLLVNPDSKISIYTTEGILIKKDCKVEDIKHLSKGFYIIKSGNKSYKIAL